MIWYLLLLLACRTPISRGIREKLNGSTFVGNVNWYKSFIDYIGTHYTHFPVTIIPVGLLEQKDTLGEQQASLLRIFRPVHIKKLSDDEVKEFFNKAFSKVNITITEEELKFLVRFSSGLPTFMQEIGDAIYWIDDDDKIDKTDAMNGVLIATERVGQKYIDPKLYRAIRNGRYKSILRKIGENFPSHFIKKDVEKRLTPEERKVLHNFLRRMHEIGVIIPDQEEELGGYKFVNELYTLYIRLESLHEKKQSKLKINI